MILLFIINLIWKIPSFYLVIHEQFSCTVDEAFKAAFSIAPDFSNTHNRLER